MACRFSLYAAALAVMTASLVAGGARSATIVTDFAGPGSAAAISGTASGIPFTLTGFTVRDDLTGERAARVGYDGRGFGVVGQTQTGGRDATGRRVVPGDFTIDGTGIDKNELLRLTFARQVTLTDLQFGFVDDYDDFYIAITGRPSSGVRISNQGKALQPFAALTGRSFDIVAGFPNPNFPGQVAGGGNDSFQLTGVDVAAIPLPAALPMLAFATAALGLVARRRRRARAA